MSGSVSAPAYLAAIREVMERVATGQTEAIGRAAELIADSVRRGGVVHAFGTGHSEALAMEIAGRAGGLVPSNRISLKDLVIRGGEPSSVLFDEKLERDPAVAHRLYALVKTEPSDVFVIASNSGINGCVVEFARLVTDHGHPLIAITSREHSARVESRHPSGRKLTDYAHVILDNGAPYGDAVLPLPAVEGESAGAVCGVSSITAALLAQLVIAEVIRLLLEAGQVPPVYLSANIPGGDAHNQELEARYAGRITRTA